MDFKLEFGRHHGEILLGDEICPDTCRFWDKATRQKLDKDRFRRDLGDVEEAYQEMLRRVEVEPSGGGISHARGLELQVRVFVTPRKGILDPQGRAVESSLKSLGFNASRVCKSAVTSCSISRRRDRSEARAEAKKMCEQLLANPMIEDYRFEVDGE